MAARKETKKKHRNWQCTTIMRALRVSNKVEKSGVILKNWNPFPIGNRSAYKACPTLCNRKPIPCEIPVNPNTKALLAEPLKGPPFSLRLVFKEHAHNYAVQLTACSLAKQITHIPVNGVISSSSSSSELLKVGFTVWRLTYVHSTFISYFEPGTTHWKQLLVNSTSISLNRKLLTGWMQVLKNINQYT